MSFSRTLISSLVLLLPGLVMARPEFQLLPSTFRPGCHQLMIANNTNRSYWVELEWKYIGYAFKEGDMMTEPVGAATRQVDPGTTHYLELITIVECSRPNRVVFNPRVRDLTAERDQIEQSRQERNRELERRERERQLEIERQRQARIELENRKRAEEAERRRQEEERRATVARMQEQSKWNRIEAYRKSDPLNARCIIRDESDIPQCERAKRAIREQEQVERQRESDRQTEVSATRRFENESRGVISDTMRRAETNNCGYAATAPAGIPIPPHRAGVSKSDYDAEVRRINALNSEMQQKFFRDLEAAGRECDARMAPQRAEQQRLQQQRAMEIQAAEQERRLAAQRKAQADLDDALVRGRQTLDNVSRQNQTIKNDNEELLRMLNGGR